MEFHKKGNVLLASSVDGTIHMWNCNNGILMNTFYGHSGAVNAARFTPDGKFIASISDDESMKIWQVSSNSEKRTIVGKNFHNSGIVSLSFHDSRSIVATGGQDFRFCISNYENGDIYHKSVEFEDVIESVCIATT